MAKKTASPRARSAATRKTAVKATARGAAPSRTKTTASKASPAPRSAKKHVGDVLGIGRAKVSKSVPSGGRRPKGIEVGSRGRKGLKPARVVGGVRGRGR